MLNKGNSETTRVRTCSCTLGCGVVNNLNDFVKSPIDSSLLGKSEDIDDAEKCVSNLIVGSLSLFHIGPLAGHIVTLPYRSND